MTALALLCLAGLLTPITWVATRIWGRDAGWLAALGLLALAGLSLTWLPDVVASQAVESTMPWMPSIDISLRLRVDALSLVFVLLALVIGALVLAYSARYLSRESRHSDYYVWMLLFAFAMVGLVLADDVIVLFVFWELTTLCSFFLIDRTGARAGEPAARTLLITMMGGLALLVAALLIATTTGTTQLSAALSSPEFQDNPAFASTVGVLVALAALTKSAQFPFHHWLPDAMVAPTPVSAYLHAAAMVKAGIYLLMRFTPALADNMVWSTILITAGLITALIGAVFALQRHDLKELLAYSTVSQLGFLVAVIGVGTPAALSAAIVHTIAHALFKSTLFMSIGIIDHQAGTRDLRRLSGLWRTMPVTMVVTVLAALSMAGVPPLLGFISKEHLFGAFLGMSAPTGVVIACTAIAVFSAICTFAYSGRIVWGAFGGYRGEVDSSSRPGATRSPVSAPTVPPPREASVAFLIPAAMPALAGLILGFAAGWLDPLIGAAVDNTTGHAEADFALWHGFNLELLLSAIVITAGTVLVVQRRRVDRLLARPLFPAEGTRLTESLRLSFVAAGRRVGDLTRTDVHGFHLAMPGALLTLLAIAGVAAGPTIGEQVDGTSRLGDWILVAMLAAFLLGTVLTKSRMVAVLLVGGAGYVVSIWYFSLGAIDVGLTQLLVEILTVVVLVLVLRKLPKTFHRVKRSRTLFTAILATVAGIVAFVGTFALTGRRDISPVGQYFLDETYAVNGANNIVNSILVDFRALDTLGELTVLGIAGFAIVAVLNSTAAMTDLRVDGLERWRQSPLYDAGNNITAIRMTLRWLSPVIIAMSLVLLVRGHYEPGGGFVAALVAGAGFALHYLAAPSDPAARMRWPYTLTISGGILIGGVTGLAGLFNGSFLRPLTADIPLPWGGSYHFSSALIFDVGIYLAVVGAVLVALNRLGQPPRYVLDESGSLVLDESAADRKGSTETAEAEDQPVLAANISEGRTSQEKP